MCKVQGVKNACVLRLYEQFRHHTHQEVSFDNFGGVSYDDLSRAEKCFDLRVTVLALQPDGLCTVERRSERSSGTELFLNEYEGHFSLVTDPDAFTQSFLCTQCLRRFTRLYGSIVHQCIGSVEIRRKFVGGAWEPQPSVFERVRSLGLSAPDMVYPYRITYDIECLLSREQLPEGTNKVTYTNRHELLSVSVCSNVPGYDTPVCLIRSGTVQELVNDFVDRLETIACRVEDLLSERLGGVLHSLQALVRQRERRWSARVGFVVPRRVGRLSGQRL